jgi:hypothetical protein
LLKLLREIEGRNSLHSRDTAVQNAAVIVSIKRVPSKRKADFGLKRVFDEPPPNPQFWGDMKSSFCSGSPRIGGWGAVRRDWSNV